MNANELKKWLKAQGCTFETKKGGSSHLVVRRGDKINDLPMHESRKELGTGLGESHQEEPRTDLMLYYRLEFESDDNGTVLVTSPDIPIATYGDDEVSAAKNAVEAIEALLQSMMDHREVIPRPGRVDGFCARLPMQTELKAALYIAMREAAMTRADLQRALGWQRESVDRLFRLDHNSKIDQLEQAFAALGKKVSPTIENIRPRAAA